jgi:hypothetical protein
VIFRKVCLGTRSATGSENVAIFASVVETAKLRVCETLKIFEALLTEPRNTPRDPLPGGGKGRVKSAKLLPF